MNLKIVSGGQTGVDQAALRAAKARGVPTGGWAPRGWVTEDGPAPWLAKFGLKECPRAGYAARTRRNVAAADATLILKVGVLRGGTRLTRDAATGAGKPHLVISLNRAGRAGVKVTEWLAGNNIHMLNVAGPRESERPGIGAMAETFLGEVLDAVLAVD